MSLGAQRDDLAPRRRRHPDRPHQGAPSRAWQLRLSLFRRAGSGRTPVVAMTGAVASRLPGVVTDQPRPDQAPATSLVVPRYSQEIHRGEYPQYNGGGEAWCSPTSTSMVMGVLAPAPEPPAVLLGQPARIDDRWVDHAARYTYASGYDGTGMWPFNTAYAARYGLDAFVTRLRSLREAELFIKAGIPLVASISFGAGSSTVAHHCDQRPPRRDPRVHCRRSRRRQRPCRADRTPVCAASTDADQFENAWSDNGGVVYVMHPRSTPLPAPGRHSNW